MDAHAAGHILLIVFIIAVGIGIVFTVVAFSQISEGTVLAKKYRHYKQVLLVDTQGETMFIPAEDQWILTLESPNGRQGEVLVAEHIWDTLDVGDYYKKS